MQGGDISNQVVPRLVIVFENLLGILPNKTAEAKAASFLKFKRWNRAVNVFEINEALARRIWDVTWRFDFSVDVITYVSEEFAEAVEKRLEREDIPVRSVWYTEPQVLARKLAYMPQVACVYDPNPHHQFTYGSKGRILDPARPDIIGAF